MNTWNIHCLYFTCYFVLSPEIQEKWAASTWEWDQQAAEWRRPSRGNETPRQLCNKGKSVYHVTYWKLHDECDQSFSCWNNGEMHEMISSKLTVISLDELFFFQAHRDGLQGEWQAFLNLCLAQETHLDNIEEYKKVTSLPRLCDWLLSHHFTAAGSKLNFCLMQFQLDAETLSDSLSRLNSTLDPQAMANKSNPEVLLAVEVPLFTHTQLLTVMRSIKTEASLTSRSNKILWLLLESLPKCPH